VRLPPPASPLPLRTASADVRVMVLAPKVANSHPTRRPAISPSPPCARPPRGSPKCPQAGPHRIRYGVAEAGVVARPLSRRPSQMAVADS